MNVSAVMVMTLVLVCVSFFSRYFYGLCHSGVSVSPRHLWIYSENVPVRSKSVSVTLDVLTTCLRLKRTCSTLEYGA